MGRSQICRNRWTTALTLLVGWCGLTLSIIALRLAIAYHQTPYPQAILVLEGRTERVDFAAHFAQAHPNLPLWVSGNPEGLALNQAIFRRAGVPSTQVYYDSCAVDTVTNFTCTVQTFAAGHIHHVYVITSDYHMARSRAIGAIVLGSRGIAITPVAVGSDGQQQESPLRLLRDSLRSLLWLFTGITGASLHRWF
ncbi:MAG: YdcF family protein [Spirulina sp.]